MGTYQVEVFISASDPTGRLVSPERLTQVLGGDPAPYAVTGLNENGANASLDVCQINLEDFTSQEEPSEAFHAATQNALQEFAVWLARISTEPSDQSQNEGLKLVALVYCWIDDNFFDLTLPPQFMAELGRLSLPLQIMTEGQ